MSLNLIYCFLCCIMLHVLAWFGTNLQLIFRAYKLGTNVVVVVNVVDDANIPY